MNTGPGRSRPIILGISLLCGFLFSVSVFAEMTKQPSGVQISGWRKYNIKAPPGSAAYITATKADLCSLTIKNEWLDCLHKVIDEPLEASGYATGRIASFFEPNELTPCMSRFAKDSSDGISCISDLFDANATKIKNLNKPNSKDQIPDFLKTELNLACGSPSEKSEYLDCTKQLISRAEENVIRLKKTMNAALNEMHIAAGALNVCINQNEERCKAEPWQKVFEEAYNAERSTARYWTSKYVTDGNKDGRALSGPKEKDGNTSLASRAGKKGKGDIDVSDPTYGHGNAVKGGTGNAKEATGNGSTSRYATIIGHGEDIHDKAQDPQTFIEKQCADQFPISGAKTVDDALRAQTWACDKLRNSDVVEFKDGLLPLFNKLSANSYIELMRSVAVKQILEAYRKQLGEGIDADSVSIRLACRQPDAVEPDYILNAIKKFNLRPYSEEQKQRYQETKTEKYRNGMLLAAIEFQENAKDAAVACAVAKPHRYNDADATAEGIVRELESYEASLELYEESHKRCIADRESMAMQFTNYPFLAGRIDFKSNKNIEENLDVVNDIVANKKNPQHLEDLMNRELRYNMAQNLTDSIVKVCGMKWEDLASMPSLIETVNQNDNKDLVSLGNCAKDRAELSKEAHQVAKNIGLTALCFAASAASSGTAASVACGSLFIASSAIELHEARTARNWTEMCLLEGGRLCNEKDYEKAREGFEEAFNNLAANVVMLGVAEGGGILFRNLLLARKAAPRLSPNELAKYAKQLTEVSEGVKAGDPIAIAEAKKIEAELAKIAKTKSAGNKPISVAETKAAAHEPNALADADEHEAFPLVTEKDPTLPLVTKKEDLRAPTVVNRAHDADTVVNPAQKNRAVAVDSQIRTEFRPPEAADVKLAKEGVATEPIPKPDSVASTARVDVALSDGKVAHFPEITLNPSKELLEKAATDPEGLIREVLTKHFTNGEAVLEVTHVESGGLAHAYKVLIKNPDGSRVVRFVKLPKYAEILETNPNALSVATARQIGLLEAQKAEGFYVTSGAVHLGDGIVMLDERAGQLLGDYARQHGRVPKGTGEFVGKVMRLEEKLGADENFKSSFSGDIGRRIYANEGIDKMPRDQVFQVLERPTFRIPASLKNEIKTAYHGRKVWKYSEYLKTMYDDPARKAEVVHLLKQNGVVPHILDSPVRYVFERPDLKIPKGILRKIREAERNGMPRPMFWKVWLKNPENAGKIEEILNMNIEQVAKDTNTMVLENGELDFFDP